MKTDFIGNELKVGDEVIFMQKSYRNLLRGTIVSMSEQKCKIQHGKTNDGGTETIQFFGQVIKVIKQ